MTIGLIVKRMRREWRSLTILLIAVCLLTGFFALGPFYIRVVTDVGLQYELDNADPESLKINLIVDNAPLTPESFQVVREELGNLAVDYTHYIRADFTAPTTAVGQNDGGLATGGYMYRYGEPITAFSPPTDNLYQPFAFDDMPELLDLVEGRWPVRLPPPKEVAPTGIDAEDERRQVGIYTRGQVEVVITQAVAERTGLELGNRIVLARPENDTYRTATVVIVGIVTPKDPNAPLWEGNRTFLDGVDIEIGLGTFRYDFGMATVPAAYTDWLADVVPGSSYIYKVDTDTDVITADNINDVNGRLQTLQNRLDAYHPGFSVLTGITSILERFTRSVEDTEGPIILLSGAILIMMLYHLINTVALVLEQQGAEWSGIVSRGGSVPQLLVMQVLTVGVLALLGMVAGPLISIGFMYIMENAGPLSQALGDNSLALGVTNIPTVSLYLSVGAAVATLLVLTLPAVPAARKSLLRLKQQVSRPPTTPAWARYGLDVVLAVIGIGFMLRLYYLVGGDFGDLLNNVIAAPGDVIELIADNLNQTGGLNDPFNLAGPALILTGAALLWLRLFPALMENVSRLFDSSRRLTTPLAVWNVARDPSHYAQLVLLLIGTLALGTASLGLTETRDRGAWKTAREETGGSARVTVDPTRIPEDESLQDVAWDRLPGVSAATHFMHVTGDPGSVSVLDLNIIGLDPDAVPGDFDEMAEIAALLRDVDLPPQGGLALPKDARYLELQVYSMPPENPDDPDVTVQFVAYLRDARGIVYDVPVVMAGGVAVGDLRSSDDQDVTIPATPPEQWRTFAGVLPQTGTPPYRLMRLGVRSRKFLAGGDSAIDFGALQHTVYIDQLTTRDLLGAAEVLDSFESDANRWAAASFANPYAPPWTSNEENVLSVQGMDFSVVQDAVSPSDGPGTLRLAYTITNTQKEPSIAVNEPDPAPVPVVVSPGFAETFAGRSTYRTAADEPLQPGDSKQLPDIELATGSTRFDYTVLGVVEDIPSFKDGDLVMVTHIDLVQPILNGHAGSPNDYFAANEAWLELPERKPGDTLKAEVNEVPGVTDVVWAWTRYGEIQREPLPSAVAGMLFAGFWISLVLSLLDFAFYLVVTARQRLFTFAVLRSLGWNASHIWRLLFVEQIVLITPALIIGSLIGAGLAYLLLPFLALVGGETLTLPLGEVIGLLLSLIVSFTVLMGIAAIFLRRMSVNQVLRLGEE